MTSTLDVAETQPAPAEPLRNAPFVVCGSLVGCASFVVAALVATKAFGATDPSWASIVATWFFGGLIGLFAGVVLTTLCVEHRPSLAQAAAPIVGALTFLAVPFLLYMAFAMVVISMLEG